MPDTQRTFVFATNNPNKVREIANQLGDRFKIKLLKDIGCTVELPETHETIPENALEKAQYVYEHYGVDCFAEDTGLEVAALDGAPGVYAARYAGPQKDAQDNMDKLLVALQGQTDRSARFRTVIALIIDGQEHLFEGIADGTIREAKTGEGGFGYDPIFQPSGHTRTFAEMTLDEKALISHRGKAVEQLVAFLNQ